MEIWQAAVIALVQGLTEFLPVSSSGHMVLAEAVLGVDTPGATWEVAFHLGTLIAVLFIFRREAWDTCAGFLAGVSRILRGAKASAVWAETVGLRMGTYILIGTIPIGLAGVALKNNIEAAFGNPLLVVGFIFLTGEMLWLSRPHGLLRRSGKLRASDAIAVGVAQAFALLPGLSRSGATIAAGLQRGVSRDEVARFSFLLAVPATLGACVLKHADLRSLPTSQLPAMGLGVAIAAVSGTLALVVLLRVVRAGKLHLFAYYCWTVSVIGAVYLWGTHAAPSF